MRGWFGTAIALPGFFALRVGSGLLLLKLSSFYLPVAAFPLFTQFMTLAALLNMVAVGGAQNGVVREVAAGTRGDAEVRAGAIGLWAAAALLIGGPLALAAAPLSRLLIGSPLGWWVVPPVVLASFLGGPGQIDCAILTGRGRLLASLAAQAAGLVLGTALAGWCLVARAPLLAVLAFAAGPAVTTLLAWLLLRGPHLPRWATPLPARVAEARRLLGYSGAFLALALLTPSLLFALRAFYRHAFGLEALGFWLVANRVSDTSTQLLGLFVTQVFMPRYSAVADARANSRVVIACWGVAAATMGGFVALFALAPGLWISVFLSPAYVGAAGLIMAYMTGDFFRVWASLAMNAAFARGRLLRYVGIELATNALFAAITLVLVARGSRLAPFVGYPLAYAAAAAVITLTYLRGVLRGRAAFSPASAAPSS